MKKHAPKVPDQGAKMNMSMPKHEGMMKPHPETLKIEREMKLHLKH